MHTAVSEPGFDLLIKRNCSISPRNLLRVLALLACVSLGIAVVFAALGAWPILPFAGLEVIALAVAFYLNGRHAGDYERIALGAGKLVVEASSAGRLDRHEFGSPWLRIDERWQGPELRLQLRSRGNALEIGRHLDTEGRAALAARIRRGLSNR